MRVLSLFDGCGMAYQAFKNLGIEVERYYASEIDKYAIQICKKNHPDVVHLGDVTKIDGKAFKDIDLIIGGFPCQSFSIAGKRLNFDDPRGQLFFHAKRLIDEIKPKYFILENVASMKKEIKDEISRILGTTPIMINASLVSAQNRKRLFWTNIPGIEHPEDKKIYLKDILENDVDEKYLVSEKGIKFITEPFRLEKKYTQIGGDKSLTVTTQANWTGTFISIDSTKRIGSFNSGGQGDRIYSTNGKSVSLSANGGGRGAKTGLYLIPGENTRIRKLTPVECERLQSLPDNYTEILDLKVYDLYIKEEINKKGESVCKEKNVRLSVANEKQKHINTENSVLNITKDSLDMELLNCLKKKAMQKKNVNIAIERLEKKVAEQEECVIDITRIGCDMETLYTQIKSRISLGQEVIKKDLTVKLSTEKYMKIILEENSTEMKSFIILILLKLIMKLKIYTFVSQKANIRFCIDNLKESQVNWLKVELSDLKMENIISCSDTQRYKMIGNGFNVKVIEHILSYIK